MSDCSCSACQQACLRKPGWFLPKEIRPLAEFLGMTEKEVFDNHLMIDYAAVVDHDIPEDYDQDLIYVLSPKLAGKKGGSIFPFDPTGRCHWFIDGKCSIHPVKPYECRQYDHTKTNKESLELHSTEIPNRWVRYQQMITDLLGYEPEIDSGAGRFGFMMDSLTGLRGLSKPYEEMTRDRHEGFSIELDMPLASYDEVIGSIYKLLGKKVFVTEVGDANLTLDLLGGGFKISNPTVSFVGFIPLSDTETKFVGSFRNCRVSVVTSPEVGARFSRNILDQTALESKEDIPNPTFESIIKHVQMLQGSITSHQSGYR